MGENAFRRSCNFKELRVVKKAHITTCALCACWHLCTASAEQIFPRDRVQRNCFELALYTTRDHDCSSNRIGSGIRNCPPCRRRITTTGALPTPSTIDRAIIMLNDCRFWGHASGPSSPSKTLHRFIRYWHTVPPAAAPYRASGLVLWHRTDMPTLLSDVRCWGQSGKHLLAASIAPFVKVFGCRPHEGGAADTGGRRTQTSKGGNRGRCGEVAR